MTESQFHGVIPPVVIPLDANRQLDLEAFERSINRMIDAGVDGLFFLGSSGEVAFLTDAQRYHVLQEAVAIFAYDIPVCVHTKLDPTMLVRLGKEGVLQGVKDSSGDDVQFRWLCIENEEAGHPLQVFTGHEVVVDGAYMSGADGSVPGLGNIDPYSYVEQWKAYQAGDWERVREIQNHLAKLMGVTRNVHATVGFGAGVGAFKTALWQMGVFNTNQMREPVQPLVGEDVEAIVAVLKANGLMDADAPVRK